MNLKLCLNYTGIILIFFSIIAFEAFQQNYYLTTYELADTAEFSVAELFLNHMWRWAIWCVTAIIFYLVLRKWAKREFTSRDFFFYVLLTICLVLLDIFIISLIGIERNDLVFSKTQLLGSFEFFIYQKGPLFVIAYICVGIYTYLYYRNKDLSVKLESLRSARSSNLKLYRKLQDQNWNDLTKVLNVRIGKKVKLIPIEEIEWIGSDNYCVKIHTKDSNHYTLRISMKRLEELLPNPLFIRIHRTAIVNTQCITEVITGRRPSVTLYSGNKIEIASSRISRVREILTAGNFTGVYHQDQEI